MANDRQQALASALGQIDKQFGKGAVMRMGDKELVPVSAIPTGALFSVTNALVALLAAGMAGQAAVYLAKANALPTLGDEVWDTSSILRDDGLLGRALHALVGYSDRPMGVQILAYLAVLIVLIGVGRLIGRAPAKAA